MHQNNYYLNSVLKNFEIYNFKKIFRYRTFSYINNIITSTFFTNRNINKIKFKRIFYIYSKKNWKK